MAPPSCTLMPCKSICCVTCYKDLGDLELSALCRVDRRDNDIHVDT